MITEYHGYQSYDEDISQTEEYDIGKQLQENDQKPNRHNETYEEDLNLPHYDVLNEITNKIRISDALSKNFMNKQSELNKSGKIKPFYAENKKIVGKNKLLTTSRPVQRNQNVPLQQSKKSRSRSLLYFQEKPHATPIHQQKNSTQKLKKPNTDLPLQIKKNFKVQEEISPSNYYLPIAQLKNQQHQKPTYFAKNQENTANNINTKRQVLLTSRSRYNLSISGVFLQNITKQYQQKKANRDYEISLKEKIQLKLIQNKSKRIKTEWTDNPDYCHHKKSTSKLYKPLDPSDVTHQGVILSTQTFQNRQQKTLENKKNKIEKLKEKKIKDEIKECTFKPKTNTGKNRKSLKK